MEWIGWFCFFIIIMYCSYPERVKKLERKVRSLQNNQKGDLLMSKLIGDLIGKTCRIINEDDTKTAWVYTILDVDDEWVKVTYRNKKDIIKTEIVRIDSIKKVDLVSE